MAAKAKKLNKSFLNEILLRIHIARYRRCSEPRSSQTKQKIKRALKEIEKDPFKGKALRDPLEGLFNFRVSRFRIVYEIKTSQKMIEILDIAQRDIVYEKLTQKNDTVLRGPYSATS